MITTERPTSPTAHSAHAALDRLTRLVAHLPSSQEWRQAVDELRAVRAFVLWSEVEVREPLLGVEPGRTA